LNIVVVLIGIATFIATMLGGFFALRLKDRLHLILGFSAGAVVGVAFFDLLPEALELGADTKAATIAATVALGFFGYLLLDRMVLRERLTGAESHAARANVAAGGLALHSFLDGLAIGLAFQVSSSVGAIVAVAVLTHDFSDGINTVNLVIRHHGEVRRAWRWLIIDAVAPIAGIVATLFVAVPRERFGFILALFAGFFLYIGASDLIPESYHAHPVRWTTITTILGASALYVMVRLANL
jgi:ZIP family zinc transporter